MFNRRAIGGLIWPLFFVAPLLSSCGYTIRYDLNHRDVARSPAAAPLKVQVATFADDRDAAEREKAARKSKGDDDVGDYTYDTEFRGKVADEITKMIVQHLNYSTVFSAQAAAAPFTSDQVSEALLDSLAQTGVDAVMTGEIGHFVGYYDKNLGRELLYGIPLGIASGLLFNFTISSGYSRTTYYLLGPGVLLGSYLESLHHRRIEQHVQFSAKLISTESHQPIWHDSFEVASSARHRMPGVSTKQRKYQVAVSSLRDAVNQMVESLAKSRLTTGRR